MKGIILSGGLGTRLYPLTKVTSKQLLPVYNRPMIMYPLDVLLSAGIKEILIIVAPDHAGDYLKLLGSGKEFGARFTYEIQDKPEGLAQAFIIGRHFIDGGDVCMILGDNLFEDDVSKIIKKFKKGGLVFVKKVADPERFGQVKFDKKMKAIEVAEKPKVKISDYALTGLYVFDKNATAIAKNLKPSARGELEVTDIVEAYLKQNELIVDIVDGEWIDAGTFDTLYRANLLAYRKSKK
ncbi:MAG TPA: sugar phosphate nucleotidyltransferase [Patescibacteria group bacterium]|nr:sugar phosphate nucleotidyltransferase [Patescibacteria group bacterium]